MKLDRPSVEELAKAKVSLERNKFYIYLLREVEEQVKTIREHIGNMRTDSLDKIRMEQGKIDGLQYMLAKPKKLMDKLIKSINSLEE